MKKLLLLTMLANYAIASDYIFYCDDQFSNNITELQAVSMIGNADFELEESQIAFAYSSDKTDLTFLKINSEAKNFDLIKNMSLKGNDNLLIDVQSTTGQDSNRHGQGFRFQSATACKDSKGTFEKYMIGGIAGNSIIQKIKCVCKATQFDQ